MKTFLVLATLFFILLMVACGKDKFQTKPRIEFKSYDKVVDPGGILVIRFNYFDKEGDLNNGSIMARKIRLNQFPPIALGDYKEDSLVYPLPDFPPKNNGEITFQTAYDRINESQTKNDTIKYLFAVTDRAGNVSDTITSDIIVARMP